MDGNWIEKTFLNSQEIPTQKSDIKLLKFTRWNKAGQPNKNLTSASYQLQGDSKNGEPMTATSLGLALIALFDQLKGTLCDMIKYDCSKL